MESTQRILSAMLLLSLTPAMVNTTENVTDVTSSNKTDTGTEKGPFSDLKFVLIIAAVLTVVAAVACCVIKVKRESATRDNIPKPLAGISEDF